MPRDWDNPISVIAKPQLYDARNANEDWTGKASASERRKLQNRLHQRAWRRRKVEVASPRPLDLHRPIQGISLPQAFAQASTAFLTPIRNKSQSESFGGSFKTLDEKGAYPALSFLSHQHHNLSKPSPPWPTCAQPHKPMLFSPIIPYLDANGENVASHPDDCRQPFHPSHFALAPDHYLITLIQYNTLRGVMTNLLLVQVTLDPACQNAVRIPLLHQLPQTPPPTFQQTPLQKRIKHESWIDSIPCPKLRDNLIIAAGSFNDDVLCDDICGGLYDGFDHVESRGLLVWGDPWLIASWEISPGFLSRWGFLLKGCEEMLRATNGWRESRGEEPLVM